MNKSKESGKKSETKMMQLMRRGHILISLYHNKNTYVNVYIENLEGGLKIVKGLYENIDSDRFSPFGSVPESPWIFMFIRHIFKTHLPIA